MVKLLLLLEQKITFGIREWKCAIKIKIGNQISLWIFGWIFVLRLKIMNTKSGIIEKRTQILEKCLQN